MKLTNGAKLLSRVGLIAALLAATAPTHAGDAGHYVGGLMNIRDYFVPDPGFYGAVYNYFYTTDRYNDQQGNRLNSTQPPVIGTLTDLTVDLDMYVLAPAFVWVSTWEVLGAKYGASIVPSFANASIQNVLTTVTGRGGSVGDSNFAAGDMLVQPLWLGWSLPHWDFSASYGFYAPVGKYSTETITIPGGSVTLPSSDNIGLGFWTQQFQGAAAWYPTTNKATAVTTALTYEYNGEQDGTGLTPGQNLWLNWGISQYLPLKKDDTLLLEVGPAGYYEWQISDSSGGLSDPDSRTQVSGIGGQIGVTYVPWMLIVNFRGFYEYHAEQRVQGASFGLNVTKKF